MASSLQRGQSTSSLDGATGAVLIVDPDPLARLVHRTVIAGATHRVFEAGTPERAAAICRNDPIAVVLVDEAVVLGDDLLSAVATSGTALVAIGDAGDAPSHALSLAKPVPSQDLLALVVKLCAPHR